MSGFNKERFSQLLQKAQGDRSLNQFGLKSGVDSGYISRFINLLRDNPPSPEILQKLADSAHNDVTYADFMQAAGYIEDENINIKKPYINIKQTDKEVPTLPDEFETPEDAMKFVLEQNVIMGFGGFDVDKLSDDEVVEFANSLLEHLKLLSFKYKK